MITMQKIDDINIHNNESTYDIGYKELDKVLGGLKSGSIITIGSRPAIGKSTFINNIIFKMLEQYNLPTLFVSLTEVKESFMLRFSTILMDIPYNNLRDDMNLKTESSMKLKDKKFNLYVSDNCYKINDLEKLIEENKDIKVLVIDYIQLMGSDKECKSKTDEFNDVLNRLRIITNKYGLIVFILSQLSRSVERRIDNRPLLADLSSSGDLEYVSDTVILLYRDGYYNENNNNILEVIVSKNRSGACGLIHLDYNSNKTKLIDYINC